MGCRFRGTHRCSRLGFTKDKFSWIVLHLLVVWCDFLDGEPQERGTPGCCLILNSEENIDVNYVIKHVASQSPQKACVDD